MSPTTFDLFLYGWIALAILLFPIQLRITAPYGRHSHAGWGWQIDNRLGWIIMELVSPLCFSYFFLSGELPKSRPMWFFFILWNLHYLHRSLLFPFRMKTKGKQIPLAIVGCAIFFNLINGSTNAYFLGSLCVPYPESWLLDGRFITGLLLFATGAAVNIRADNHLLALRKPGESGYKIPQGGLFRLISCPNHFGEILEWSGFAIMCWNLPALSFAIWTAANLIPRAVSHHRWYLQHFPDYPKNRKAVIPFLW